MVSPLAQALPAMTALQATVALGLFGLSVLAPQLGLSLAQLAALNTLMFAVGTLGALTAGRWLQRFGDWNVAAGCAAAVAGGMLCLLAGGAWAPWCAVLLFGMAFGPETPASASVLTRVTPAPRRPWIFSVRQTGNQIGAVLGSLTLPALWVVDARLPYAAVALVALSMAGWCLILSRGDPRVATARPPGGVERAALRQVAASAPLRALAFAALCYTAVQMCLNTFLMTLAVRDWQLPVAQAAACVAGLQAAGFAGRLAWGALAQRLRSADRLLAGLGLLISASGALLMLGPRDGVWPLLALALLGFSASGWNGVLVAEVSRIAGPEQAGALTGAVLMFGYLGLTLAPLAFAAGSAVASMTSAFLLLFGLAALAAAGLWRRSAG
jgi:MFS family permease